MNVIPAPQRVELQDNTCWRVPAELNVCCEADDVPLFELLQLRLQTLCGRELTLAFAHEGRAIAGSAASVLRVIRAHSELTGWHQIDVAPDVVTISCASQEGLGYALVTFFHLMRAGDVPCGVIEDWPAYEHRGQQLDTVRHFFSIEEIERIVEQLSLLKINRLHWVFANDQAWRIESRSYSKLTERCAGQSYTAEQVRELVAYARLRGVEIVPEFEIPGHSSAAIAAYPELCCSGKQIDPPATGGVFSFILCGGKDTTYTFIRAILEELLELFPGPVFHLGGDEAPKEEWDACPHCQAKMRALGLQKTADLQAHLLNYAAGILRERGRQAICWNECLASTNVDSDIAVQFWSDSSDRGVCTPEVNTGRRFVLSSFRPLYLDYPFSVSNLQDVYGYEPNVGGVAIRQADVLGIESALWTEHIETTDRLEYLLFPRVLATAELAWGTNHDYDDFHRRVEAYVELLERAGIAAAPLTDAEVHGPRRWWQNLCFAAFMIRYVFVMQKSQRRIRETAR